MAGQDCGHRTDSGARLGHLSRTRMRFWQEEREKLGVPARKKGPWNMALQAVATDDKYWAHEFVEPAMIVVADPKLLTSM